MKRLLYVAALLVSSTLFGGVASAEVFTYGESETGAAPPTYADFVAVEGSGSWLNPVISTQFSGSLLENHGVHDGASFGNGANPIQTVQFSADDGATWVDALAGALGSLVTVAPTGPPTPFVAVSGTVSSGLAGTFNRVRLLLNGDLSEGDQLELVGRIDVQSIPEPSTWAMILAGLMFVVSVAKRRMG